MPLATPAIACRLLMGSIGLPPDGPLDYNNRRMRVPLSDDPLTEPVADPGCAITIIGWIASGPIKSSGSLGAGPWAGSTNQPIRTSGARWGSRPPAAPPI